LIETKMLVSPEKARGAFYTPLPLAEFIAGWAIRNPNDRVMEPSAGSAAFLEAAALAFRALGADPRKHQIQAYEIDAESARQSAEALNAQSVRANVIAQDFFDVIPSDNFDAVIGNPPYVRYQHFAGEFRAKAQRAALAQGVRLPGLASSWAAFVVHAAGFLKPSGRLGLVLPAELLTVNYAAPIRQFLMQRFAHVRLVLFSSRVFPDVEAEVLLLLAEGTGPSGTCELVQADGIESLSSVIPESWSPNASGEKWTTALLRPEELHAYSRLASSDSFTPLENYGHVDLGMVTGNNDFFTVGRSEARKLKLPSHELLRISPAGSRHLRKLTYTRSDWERMANTGANVYLVRPRGEPSAAASRLFRSGVKQGVQAAYKCRVRDPWWRVPLVGIPDMFVTYMNHDTVRLVTNTARVRHLNSVHGLSLNADVRAIALNLLPLASLNSLSLLGAELVGRSYGGGVLKVEPREAMKLPVPSAALLRQSEPALARLKACIDSRPLRDQTLMQIVKAVDDILLVGSIGLTDDDVTALSRARATFVGRRTAGRNHVI
jgi:adenine-specific DNA-methyltransferase